MRSLARRVFSCTCTDFRVNGLGTCKHVEAVLLHLEARFPKLFAKALEDGSDRIDVVWDDRLDTLRIENGMDRKPVALSEFFDEEGSLLLNHDSEEVVETLGRLDIPSLRILHEVPYRLELRRRRAERVILRREYEEKVQAGIYPQHETKVPNEAQRIKNWNTKTAQAIKRLQSRYAFVLTGTPIENRIDEIYSIVDFLDPTVFGPLFRFNREFYQLSARGRPEEYQNLELLRERVRPLMLRRRKADVETELPARMDRNLFVALSHQQLETYRDHEAVVARLVQLAKRRPLTQQEQERLIRELSMMRMVCDTFLSTDSGGVGLNLQNASVVINCDLPWNPAKLEQRIARAWRKNQLRAVTVINLISENTIEHRILGTLAAKQSLADGVLDAIGNLNEVKLQRKGQTFFERLELMLGPRIHLKAPPPPPFAPPADPAEAFARHAAQLLASSLCTYLKNSKKLRSSGAVS